MIVKFLKAANGFPAIGYNFDKVAAGQAEVMTVVNFDALKALTELRPGDYENHLLAVSALNKNISQPQLHVAISATEQEQSKAELTLIAKDWMAEMGYAKQPYLIFFHNDSPNNHVHVLSTRVDHDGRKINSGFERVRGLEAMNRIMGLDEGKAWRNDVEKALSYRFANIAQFKLLLEKQGYIIKENNLIKFGKKLTTLDFDKLEFKPPSPQRAAQLSAIFKKYASQYNMPRFASYLKDKFGIDLVLHAKDGKPAYGYTVIDHAQKNVYKGGEILPLKQLLAVQEPTFFPQRIKFPVTAPLQTLSKEKEAIHFSVNISKDIDDDQIHGPRRRRKRKARTNTR